jgi:mono/diheme cytochrome c family protein
LSAQIRRGVALATTAVVVLSTPVGAQPRGAYQNPWRECCGVSPWPKGRGLLGPYDQNMRETWPDMARHTVAKMGGAPGRYAGLSNPLPRTRATLDHGAKVYAADCASCHGQTGWGDGPAGLKLSPPPADLAWLWRMPTSQWDGFMYWTVADGGAPLGTTMPAHKQKLSKDDAWSVIAYIQSRLPEVGKEVR